MKLFESFYSRAALLLITTLVGVVTAVIYFRPSHEIPPETPSEISESEQIEQPTNRPVAVSTNGYVGSDTCQSCHAREHETWYHSYHRTMTQVASDDSIIGEFDSVLAMDGVQFRLRRDSGKYWFDVLQQGSVNQTQYIQPALSHEVVLTTGSHHMQVCWFAIQDDSRIVGMLPFTYLKEADRWIPRKATFLKPPSQQAMEVGRWNSSCIRCHVTFGQANANGQPKSQQSLTDRTQVAEFGISCEACHGPGNDHVLSAQKAGTNPDVTIDRLAHPERMDHRTSSQVCGQCHSVQRFHPDEATRWASDGFDYRPGKDLSQSKMRYLVQCSGGASDQYPDGWETQFWSDGMVRVSGREYNGLVESVCFQSGELSCISCHELHPDSSDNRSFADWSDDQLQERMHTNAACIQCHQKYEDAELLTKHTHHKSGSSGSECMNCHMPYTTFGLLKAIRSHQIDSPNVRSSLATGRPNSCNQCHLDRSLGWAADTLQEWYGIKKPNLSHEQETTAASVSWILSGDAGQRALIAWSYGWKNAQQISDANWMAPFLSELLDDPYDAVRFIAFRSLRTIPEYEAFEYDFLSTTEQQIQAAKKVMQLWNSQQNSISSEHAEAVLIDENGQLRKATYDQLRSRRNDQPVTLNE